MNNKKKVLIIEGLYHFWQVTEVFNLLKNDFECKVLIPKSVSHLINIGEDFKIKSRFKYFILLKAFFIGHKFDYIYFNTSPEYPDYPKDIKSFLIYFQQLMIFLFFLILFNKKIILYVRGIYRFIPNLNKNSKYKIYIWIRCKIFLLARRFVCENKNLTYLLKNFLPPSKKYLVTTLYTRFNSYKKNKSLRGKKFTIGLLGAIDPERKDYKLIYDYVNKNKYKIKINFLGQCVSRKSFNIINNFRANELNFSKIYLNEQDFIKWGQECDVLISLNKKDLFYGESKGTGSFGDAISLNKPLIAPYFSDPIKEFSSFTCYFRNKFELEKVLDQFMEKIYNKKINFNNFSLHLLKNQFIHDLKISV